MSFKTNLKGVPPTKDRPTSCCLPWMLKQHSVCVVDGDPWRVLLELNERLADST